MFQKILGFVLPVLILAAAIMGMILVLSSWPSEIPP
jgi:hypothetical protein